MVWYQDGGKSRSGLRIGDLEPVCDLSRQGRILVYLDVVLEFIWIALQTTSKVWDELESTH